jgi:hypothetical protein
MLVLEKLRDSYASADFATQFLEAAIRKADIDVTMRGSRVRQEQPQAAMNMDKVNEMRRRSEAARWSPPLSDDHGLEQDFSGSHAAGIRIPVSRPDNLHNTISARTPESENAISHDQSNKSELEFYAAANAAADVDLNDFLTFDTGNEMWNVPLEEGAHGESGGFMGDMNWVEAPGWGHMMSPSPDITQQEPQDLFGSEGLGKAQEALA